MRKKFSVPEVIRRLKAVSVPADLEGMARFGINTKRALGVSIPKLRGLAREIGTDHALAAALWRTRVHEARILAGLVDDPARVTDAQMERWARGFDSWDVCDLMCGNLFDQTAHAWAKAVEWSARDEEFVKRAGFVLMAALSVHDKKAPDAKFRRFFPIIRREAGDERNFVKKAVNWALRQIGKRNAALNRDAVRCGESVAKQGSRSARWIAADALRELRSEGVRRRIEAKHGR